MDRAEFGGLLARGSAVLALGAADSGREALALWQVSPDGAPTGAWVVPSTEAFTQEGTARHLLSALEGRPVTAAESDTVDAIFAGLGSAALLNINDRWWAPHVFSTTEVFAELVQRRSDYDKTVETHRQSVKSVTRLNWRRDFGDGELPGGFEDLRKLSRLAAAPAPPVVSQALTMSRVLHWLIGLWDETEQVKRRRRYVAAAHGRREPLPPSWWAAAQAAHKNGVPL